MYKKLFSLLCLLSILFTACHRLKAPESNETLPAIVPNDLSGLYDITDGKARDGTTAYTGTAEFKKLHHGYTVRWKLSDAKVYAGICIISESILSCAYGEDESYGVIVYKVDETKLSGEWTTPSALKQGLANSEDTLEGPPDLKGLYTITSGKSAMSGEAYSGTATIIPTNQVYIINWTILGQVYSGVGVLQDKILSAAFAVGSSTGIAAYKIDNDTLHGTWASTAADTTGSEILKKRVKK